VRLHEPGNGIEFVGISLMVALVLAFPAIVLRDAPPEASSIREIQIETSPDDNFLPPEWR
jgi:hypothetical protein